MAQKREKKWTFPLLLLFCVAVFSFSACKLMGYLTEYRRGEQEYSELSTAVITGAEEEGQPSSPADGAKNPLKVDFGKLEGINEDVVGWILVEGTSINYPIVQGMDNEYYLGHTFRKKSNQGGAIFMDAVNQEDFSSDNTILYGHNLKTGKMFGTLRFYEDKEYWKEHPMIWVITPKKSIQYQIFSVFTTEASSEVYTVEFSGGNAFASYLTRCTQASIYNTGVKTGSDDYILTLSTCTSDTEEGRRIVQAKKIYEEENGDEQNGRKEGQD